MAYRPGVSDRLRRRGAAPEPRAKDGFDKIATLTVPFVTLVLGLLGAYATWANNRANLDQQRAQTDSALRSQMVQAVADRRQRQDQALAAQKLAETQALERLFPFATSADPKRRLFGYEMFAAMGRGELAAQLAAATGDKAAIPLLRRLRANPDAAISRAAGAGLAQLLAPENRTTLLTRYEAASGTAAAGRGDAINQVLDLVRANAAGLTPRQAGFVLATIEHDTARTFRSLAERGTAEDLDRRYAGKLGNSEPGDGYRYRGRGYAQLTGRANYAAMNRRLALEGTADDLVLNPDRASDPGIAFRIMGQFTFEGTRGDQMKAALAASDYARARRLSGATTGVADIAARTTVFECLLAPDAATRRCG